MDDISRANRFNEILFASTPIGLIFLDRALNVIVSKLYYVENYD